MSAIFRSRRHRALTTSHHRLLVIAAEFPPLGGGGVIRVTKLVKYLHRLGWRIEVACSDEPLATAVDPSLLKEVPEAVGIRRIRPPFHRLSRGMTAQAKEKLPRRSLVFRVLFRAREAVRRMVAIPDRWLPWALMVASDRGLQPAQVIVGSGPPHSVHVASALLSRRWRVPYVVDMRDEWTLRPLTRSRIPWRVIIERRLERWCLSRAAAVVVVSEESRNRYAKRYPWVHDRIVVIPNGFDTEDFDGLGDDSPSENSTLALGYGGSFQVGTDIDPLFEAIGVAVKKEVRGRRVRFEMMGPFLPEQIEAARRHIGSDALSVRSFLPHREALRVMAAWDALCVIATDGEVSLAGKIYEYLALRKPIVVVAPEGPATRLVRGLGAGSVGTPNNAASIRVAIAEALSMSEGFAGVPASALSDYDRRLHAERWSQLLERVIDRHLCNG